MTTMNSNEETNTPDGKEGEALPERVWLTVFTDDKDPRFIMSDWRTSEVRNTQPGDYVAIRPHYKVEYVPRASVAAPEGDAQHTNTMEDGRVIDVDRLLCVLGQAMLSGRRTEPKLISDLRPVGRSAESGFSDERYAGADPGFAVIISPTKEVLDGRHRLCKANDRNQLTVPTVTATWEEIARCVVPTKDPDRDKRPITCHARH